MCDYSPELQALGRQISLLVPHPSYSPVLLTQELYRGGSRRERDWEFLSRSPKGDQAKAFYCKDWGLLHLLL